MNSLIYKNLELMPLDLQGWNGNSMVFEQLILKTNPKIIIEVGTWKGQSAINMATCIKKFNLDTHIYCIDTWLGAIEFLTTHKDTTERNLLHKNGYPQIYYQFISNVVHTGNQDYITPIPNTSITGFKYLQYSDIKADLIYIDASHEEEDVYLDIVNYFQLLNDGGIIFGDDFTSWPGVERAITRFCNERNIQFEVLENNFWVISK